MPDVKQFVIDNTTITVKDEIARTSASQAVSTANEAMTKVEEIEALERLVISYNSTNETITFTRETHEEVNNG